MTQEEDNALYELGRRDGENSTFMDGLAGIAGSLIPNTAEGLREKKIYEAGYKYSLEHRHDGDLAFWELPKNSSSPDTSSYDEEVETVEESSTEYSSSSDEESWSSRAKSGLGLLVSFGVISLLSLGGLVLTGIIITKNKTSATPSQGYFILNDTPKESKPYFILNDKPPLPKHYNGSPKYPKGNYNGPDDFGGAAPSRR